MTARDGKPGALLMFLILVAVVLMIGGIVAETGPPARPAYVAPEDALGESWYAAIQLQYDQGDCAGLDSIIQGWSEPPYDPRAESFIAEAEHAKWSLGC